MLLCIFFCASGAWAAELTLAEVDELFLEARYEKVVTEADALIDARSSGREELYYLKGLSQLKLGKFGEARASFEGLRSKYPKSSRGFDALVGVGDAYFLEGKANEAARIYNEVLSAYPKGRNINSVYYKLGDSYQRMGLNDKAQQYFGMAGSAASVASAQTVALMTNITPRGGASSFAGNCLSVQIGSFKNSDNADRLSRQMGAKGYDSHVETVSDTKGTFYRVKVGRCVSRSEAERLESQLISLGHSTKICDYDESR
jgi:tetratricopeptide (TPR) repeat protein